MSKWDSEKAKSNLLSLSREQANFKVATTEWCWTGDFIDHSMPIETCQLCEHTRLRYHFKISNSQTNNFLLVGSECILRFDIAVYGDDGKLLEGKTKEKRLDDKIQEAQIEQALKPLRELWKRVNNLDQSFIKHCAEYIKNRQGLLPQYLLAIFKLMNQHDIEFDSRLYRVILRSSSHKHELLRMSENELQLIWDCLTSKQKGSIKN